MFAPRGWLKRPVARRIYRTLAQSELFDRSWYRRYQAQGSEKLGDPLWHYLDHGWKKHLDPSPHFDTSHYLLRNHDVSQSGLNPLFHYLEYGLQERRSPLRSVRQTFDHYFPDATELRAFLTPRVGSPRMTMVIDHRSMAAGESSLSDLVEVVAGFAQEHSRHVRILCSTEARPSLLAAIRSLSQPAPPLDIVDHQPAHDSITHEVHDDELFVATSWTSCASLRCVAPSKQIFCAIPVAVAETSGFVSPTHRKQAKGTPPSWSLVPHGDGLWRQWAAHSETPRASNSNLVANVSPGSTRSAEEAHLHIGIFAEPEQSPLPFLFALAALENWILSTQKSPSDVSLTLWGPGVEPVACAESIHATRASDHPPSSLLPLDMSIVCVDSVELVHSISQQGGRVQSIADADDALAFSQSIRSSLQELTASGQGAPQ